jgi:hypothetical protein
MSDEATCGPDASLPRDPAGSVSLAGMATVDAEVARSRPSADGAVQRAAGR